MRHAPIDDGVRGKAALHVFAQIAGGVAGTPIAHGMFDRSLLQVSKTVYTAQAGESLSL
jgi:hypothetical protein